MQQKKLKLFRAVVTRQVMPSRPRLSDSVRLRLAQVYTSRQLTFKIQDLAPTSTLLSLWVTLPQPTIKGEFTAPKRTLIQLLSLSQSQQEFLLEKLLQTPIQVSDKTRLVPHFTIQIKMHKELSLTTLTLRLASHRERFLNLGILERTSSLLLISQDQVNTNR